MPANGESEGGRYGGWVGVLLTDIAHWRSLIAVGQVIKHKDSKNVVLCCLVGWAGAMRAKIERSWLRTRAACTKGLMRAYGRFAWNCRMITDWAYHALKAEAVEALLCRSGTWSPS